MRTWWTECGSRDSVQAKATAPVGHHMRMRTRIASSAANARASDRPGGTACERRSFRGALGRVLVPSLLSIWTAACAPDTEPPPSTEPSTGLTATELVEKADARWITRARADLLGARDLYQRAAHLDPGLAGAWSGLANVSALIGLYSILPAPDVMPEALRAADRALELDPEDAGSHASRGLVLYLHDWDFPGAEQAFRRALELDPDQINAHHWFGMMLSVLGRHDEALSHMMEAATAAPHSALLATKIGTLQLTAGQLDTARATLGSALDRFPTSPLPHRELGYVELAAGRPDLAVDRFAEALRLATETAEAGPLELPQRIETGDPKLLVALALALRRSGRELVHEISTGSPGDSRPFPLGADALVGALRGRAEFEFFSPVTRARLEVVAGDGEAAIVWLERAHGQRDPGLVYLRAKPSFEELASDPRYLELCRLLGI